MSFGGRTNVSKSSQVFEKLFPDISKNSNSDGREPRLASSL